MQKIVARGAVGAAAVVGAVGVFVFALTIRYRPAEDLSDPTVDQELLVIYAPGDLIDWLKVFDVETIADNAALRRLVDRFDSRDHWIVTLTCFYQKSGMVTSVPQIIELGKQDSLFPLTKIYFKTLAGKAPPVSSNPRIVVIPERLLEKDPRQVLPELLAL